MKRKDKNAESQALALSKPLQEKFIWFLNNFPPDRVSHNLRRLFVEFMTHEFAAESPHLSEISIDLQGVFDLLDVAEKELLTRQPVR